MAIDPSIPFRAATAAHVNLADIYAQADEQKYRDQQMQMRQQEIDSRAADASRKQQAATSLSQLVQQRAAGGKWDTASPEFQSYAQNDPDGALQILKGMDEQQRKQVEEGVKDLSAAVQWADSPEKWAVVQRHYGAIDPQLAAVPFDRRQESLISLGQMGEYLKATAPKIMSIEAGGSLAAVDPRTGHPNFTVLPNPGGASPGAPAAGGGVSEGATATNPQTGEKIQFRGGQWVPMGEGGGGGRVTSNFLNGF